MTRRGVSLALAVAAVAAALSPLVAAAPARADTTLPFKDANVVGSIGFCDKANKPVTSGNIRDVPFVFKAVSDTAVPKAWAPPLGKAALYAFSPVKDVNPGEWSPYQMTASSLYTNPAHPMTAATYRDAPLEYQTTGFPATLEGLVQLRMYYSAPNQQAHLQPYPAAVIRVTGQTWSMVAGDRNPACTAGRATSISTVRLPASMLPSSAPSWAANAKPSVTPSSSAAPGATSSATPGAAASDGSVLNADGTAASSTSSTSSASIWPIALGMLGVTVLGAGGFALWAARRPTDNV